MRRSRGIVLVAAFFALASCSESGPSTGRAGSPVEQAISLVPSDATGLYFTHWAELAENPEDILYDSEGAEQLYEELEPRGLVPAASFDSYVYPDFEELWGWNTDDLEWEAVFYEPAVYMLRFREPIDTGDLTGRLDERGYTKTEEGGVDVYHHDEALDEEWFADNFGNRTPLSVLNMAVVDDETLLLSGDEDGLSAAVEAIAEGESGDTPMAGAVAPVKDSPVVMAFPAGDLCDLAAGVRAADEGALEHVDALEGHGYEALAIGVTGLDEEPGGTVVVHYADEADAEADLELREAAARGTSLVTRVPYEQVSFTLEEAEVVGTDLLLEFSPSEGGTLGFADAVRAGDLTFAAC